MSIDSLISRLKRKWPQQVVAVRKLPPEEPHFHPLKKPLPGILLKIIKGKNITRLYTHQTEAISAIRYGHDTAVVSPAASGKTLIYNLPILEKILKEPRTSALYLFPTKALAQDQAKNIAEICRAIMKVKKNKINVEIFDGDTPASKRRQIKQKIPQILISNPDMLHLSFLGHHNQWAGFFQQLKYVVVDEAHYYRGVVGAHFALVLKRLKRVLKFYGAKPQFLVFSATLANPREFLEKLFETSFHLIVAKGAPRGAKHFLFWRPEGSPYQESKRLFLECVQAGLKTIVFTKSRKITELIYTWAVTESPKLADKISAYRAGYLPEERRQIEKKLFSGELVGVVATSALELGIDIGGLDVCILVGFPGTLISTWQRVGRVGRGLRDALIIFVGLPDALDQYFLAHPTELFKRPLEMALVDDQNMIIASDHLLCAAREIPLGFEEPLIGRYRPALELLVARGQILLAGDGKKYFSRISRPHQQVNLRSIGPSYRIKGADTFKIIGQIEYPKVLRECYPGAIYLHAGNRWEVTDLNLNEKQVLVLPSSVDYYTEPRTFEEVEILQVKKKKTAPEGKFFFGRIRVTENIYGYVKKRISDGKIIEEIPLTLPPYIFETEGVWFEINEKIRQEILQKNLNFAGGLHAVEHALIGIIPAYILCDRFDLGGVSYQFFPETVTALIFIYDAYPGGLGLGDRVFEIAADLFGSALKLIHDCSCFDGCPGCIQSPKCGNGNQPLDKKAALFILEHLTKNSRQYRRAKIIESPGKIDDVRRRIIFFDLETQHLFSEVGGRFPEKLKLSVGVTYDVVRDRFFYFDENNIEDLFKDLLNADLVVGFNIHQFDWLVLKPYCQEKFNKIKSFDILEYIHNKLRFRISLDNLAKSTLGHGKTADGFQAVAWFKEGEMDKIRDYCRQDVEIIRQLYDFGKKFRYVLFEKNGQEYRLPVDW